MSTTQGDRAMMQILTDGRRLKESFFSIPNKVKDTNNPIRVPTWVGVRFPAGMWRFARTLLHVVLPHAEQGAAILLDFGASRAKWSHEAVDHPEKDQQGNEEAERGSNSSSIAEEEERR